MIWALLAAYFLSGGVGGISGGALTSAGVKQLGEQAEAVIDDPARSEAVQQTIKALRKDVKAFEKMFTKSGSKLTKSYRDHAANRDQAIAILDDLNSEWAAAQQHVLDLRFELKDSMTEAEWTALFDGK